jgi:flagellar M-ring protein FliF
VQGFVEFLKTLGAARLAAMAAVTLALVAMFAFIIMRVTTPQMTTLFTDLTMEDSASSSKNWSATALPTSSRTTAQRLSRPATG